jgi:phosphatidylglycerophosphate synthase
MTLFRWWAARRGVVIAADGGGKLKTIFQSIFIGATIAWFAFRDAWRPLGLGGSEFGRFWNEFHGAFVALTLGIALALTIYSFVKYVYRHRRLFQTGSQG